MKVTSLKAIYFSREEMKSIMTNFISQYDPVLADHMRKNSCTMEWTFPSKMLGETFVISIDGEIVDEKIIIPPSSGEKPSDIPF